MAGQSIPLDPISVAEEAPFQDAAELDIADEEGRLILRQHLHRERSSRLVREFKRSLVDFSCRVCGFDFLRVYGEVGRGFIEAHHTKPVAELGTNETVRVQDLLPVCSNCHRMLHRKYPSMDWRQLKDCVTQSFMDRT